MEILKAILTGFACGVIFSLFGLPIPAPPVLAGIAGIVGIWFGFVIVKHFRP